MTDWWRLQARNIHLGEVVSQNVMFLHYLRVLPVVWIETVAYNFYPRKNKPFPCRGAACWLGSNLVVGKFIQFSNANNIVFGGSGKFYNFIATVMLF